jgi:glutamate dehydrogenase
MRYLRRQLIELLNLARQQHRMDIVPPRLLAALVQDFHSLLPIGKKRRVAMRSRTLSHGNLHRHIFTIRCPDQAFYLDAIKGYLLRRDIQPISQQTMVARMACGPDGCDLELRQPDVFDEDNFMFIALHISATLTPESEPLRRDIQAILQAVDLSVRSFMPMRRAIAGCVALLMQDNSDAAALLDWMNDNHYLYFGILHGDKHLGLFRNRRVFNRVAPGLAEDIASFSAAETPGIDWLNLSSSQHYLYSAAIIEVVRVSWTNREGELECAIIIGHFSRSARFTNASYLPILSKHWRTLSDDPLLLYSAFYRREIRTLFDRMPKRILLATRPEDWLAPLKAIIDLADPMQVVAHTLPSRHGNLDALMIAITAKRFGPTVMARMLQSLHGAGLVTHGYDSFGTGPHRIIIIGIDSPAPDISGKRLNDLVRRSIVFWKDSAKSELLRHADTFDLPGALKELEDIPPLYQELFPPAQFPRDLAMRQSVLESGRTRVHVSPRPGAGENIELHIYSLEQPSLGKLVDIIRAFGLNPVQESVVAFGKDPECATSPASGCGCIHISSLTCRTPVHLKHEDAQRLRRALALVLNDDADHDPINALLVYAALDIDEIAILITLRNHLIQLLPDAAKLPLSDMMLRHPQVTGCLQKLFTARHLAAMPTDYPAEAREAFYQAMQDIENLSDDRWFRAMAELADASLRTNAFVRQRGSPVAIKIDPRQLSFAATPRPYREIFVHGVHLEGVHLRAGPIARGGLRYSDRPADFRTEVMELMSTQTIKNGQIVPTGSKGGFVVRDGDGPKFVLAQYRLFIRSLLALTDNLKAGKAIAPAGITVPAEDSNDPYFVVAADKGTAHFSDDANAESQAAGFWLDDAFASGGRHGYDHKAAGITARGAWICAAHHFARMGVDAWRDAISCVGIGDMGGDVFGNGMLLNPQLKLIAAFNHRHIFLDPNPQPAKAFGERKRLFHAACGWDHYHAELISPGGGVFERSAKRIALSVKARKALGIEQDALSGEALIQAILTAPVDLLYNGGIGTYVKAASETQIEVRDPANNAVRVDAGALRCKVVCEGGNLGLTQKARIEFAAGGGAINTDAMDNSAGVDMSDHEVNIKILLASIGGGKRSRRLRNQLLESLTDAVTEQCLNDNLMQSRALTLAEHDASEHPPRMQRLRDRLTKLGWLDPAVAPRMDEDDMLPLRPQLSVLLGQEKNRIHQALSDQSFFRMSACGERLLQQYFPVALHKKYGAAFAAHALAGEIIHTQAANHVVNHYGLGAVHHLETLLDASISDIVEGLLIAEILLDIEPLRQAIWDHLSDMASAARLQRRLQEYLMLFAEKLVRLCPVSKLDMDWVRRRQKGLRQFRLAISSNGLAGLADAAPDELMELITGEGLPDKYALHLAAMPQLAQSACAVHLASLLKLPLGRCLLASQACLKLLPIDHIEAALQTADWGDEDAHSLRREWLHRLTLLQSRAIAQLLAEPGNRFESAGERLWKQHRYWPDMDAWWQEKADRRKTTDPKAAESRRMRLLLAMTRLESIAGNNDPGKPGWQRLHGASS